jgi:hypothetical protein
MAATDPRQHEPDDRYGRPTLTSTPTIAPRRWRWVVIGLVVVVIGAIAYALLYGGGGGSGGGGTGNGGGYMILAFSIDQLRRLRERARTIIAVRS